MEENKLKKVTIFLKNQNQRLILLYDKSKEYSITYCFWYKDKMIATVYKSEVQAILYHDEIE